MKKKRLAGFSIIALALFVIFLWLFLGRRMEREEWLNLEENEFAILWNQELLTEKGRLEDGHPYVALDFVAKNWNQRFYWEEKDSAIHYILPTEVMRIAPDEQTYTVGEKIIETEVPVLMERDGKGWILLDLVAEYTESSMEFSGDLCIAWVDFEDTFVFDTLNKNTKLRVKAGFFQRNLGELAEGTEVYLIESSVSWSKVMTKEGLVGYVRTDSLSGELRGEAWIPEQKGPEYTSIQLEEDIILGWNYIADAPYGLDALKQCMELNPAINVVSPTWFVLDDNEGGFDSHADHAYVEYAREKGLMIWGMVENMTGKVDSQAILTNPDSRENLVSNLVAAAEEYDLDGLNVDFESLKAESGPAYLQFLRELSMECRIRGLVLSVDNYVPKPWTAFYDRKEQGEIVDYVVIMGYDEHYAGGGKAGSSASLKFVEEGIQDTLKEVSKEKVINAIPFYARIWMTTPAELSDGSGVKIQDKELGECYLTSASKGMGYSLNLKENHEYEWLEEIGQNYVCYMEEGIRYEMWLEDLDSMKARMDMIGQYDLAGIACWRLGLEIPEVWEILTE